MNVSEHCILQVLPAKYNQLYLAYSGGLDSQVLLHLCAMIPSLRLNITAVYIHHGLQLIADEWQAHCQAQAQALNIRFHAIKVNAQPKVGESPESAARNARYAAFRSIMKQDDVLLLAHHREDQLETLLLQLFRGTGVAGLAAMPKSTRFGLGVMLRPLLDYPKAQLQQYAHQHQLNWVDDPSNQCDDFDRNFLRNQIIPLLKTRWPNLDKTVARAAAHCGEAADLISQWANQQLVNIVDNQHCLVLSDWQLYTESQRHYLLRIWLQQFGLRPPSQALLTNIINDVIFAKADRYPEVFIQGNFLKKFQNKLYCLPEAYFNKQTEQADWLHNQNYFPLNNGYYLYAKLACNGIAEQLWQHAKITIVPRLGGEKIKLPNRYGHHSLKKLYQEANIPPWERELRPLIYLDGRLAAVPGLWVAEWAWLQQENACYQIELKVMNN